VENTRQKTKLNTTENIHTTHNQTTQNTTKQNYLGLVTYYNTRPGNEVGFFYNAPEPTWAYKNIQNIKILRSKYYNCNIL